MCQPVAPVLRHARVFVGRAVPAILLLMNPRLTLCALFGRPCYGLGPPSLYPLLCCAASRRIPGFLIQILVKPKASRYGGRVPTGCPLWVKSRHFAVQNGMSALPPKATVKADSANAVMSALPLKANMCGERADVC